ncbi:hypothetical protein MRX96_003999 [Rhipicephalus microplus]
MENTEPARGDAGARKSYIFINAVLRAAVGGTGSPACFDTLLKFMLRERWWRSLPIPRNTHVVEPWLGRWLALTCAPVAHSRARRNAISGLKRACRLPVQVEAVLELCTGPCHSSFAANFMTDKLSSSVSVDLRLTVVNPVGICDG